MRLDDGVHMGWFAVELGFRQRWVLADLVFNIVFAAVINTRFQMCVTFGKLVRGAGSLGGGGGGWQERLDGLPLLYSPMYIFPGVGGVPEALFSLRRRFSMHNSGTRGRGCVVSTAVQSIVVQV